MNIPRYLSICCCMVMLGGCFDSPDDQSTKDNTDGAKSSIQMNAPADKGDAK
ncbi:hypothetical protein [Pseudomonas sp. DWP3-1-2]|uniref:hypothetical protein n=1 Tax=Pseudomonas sp. DWP3-1-2 TaxID=2804645 RepID=UPI003CE95926